MPGLSQAWPRARVPSSEKLQLIDLSAHRRQGVEAPDMLSARGSPWRPQVCPRAWLNPQCNLQVKPCFQKLQKRKEASKIRRQHRLAASETEEIQEKPAENKGKELENPESEANRKKEEADRLRAAEKFMKVGTGEAFCKGCGYEYKPSKGDPEYPISAGTYFQDLPKDWQCPICGAQKNTFENRAKEIAGFEENQGYGFGTNTMTSGQKSILIYGSLLAFFALFCAGYLLQ